MSPQFLLFITRASLRSLSHTVSKPILLHPQYPRISPKNHRRILTTLQIRNPQRQPHNPLLLHLSLEKVHRLAQTVALRQRHFGGATPTETPFATRAVSYSVSVSSRFAAHQANFIFSPWSCLALQCWMRVFSEAFHVIPLPHDFFAHCLSSIRSIPQSSPYCTTCEYRAYTYTSFCRTRPAGGTAFFSGAVSSGHANACRIAPRRFSTTKAP